MSIGCKDCNRGLVLRNGIHYSELGLPVGICWETVEKEQKAEARQHTRVKCRECGDEFETSDEVERFDCCSLYEFDLII